MNRVQSTPNDDTERFIREFYQVLNQITDDYPNDFRNIKGGYLSDDSKTDWSTTAKLPEASESYITRNFDQSYGYVSVFYQDSDRDMALTIYENLSWLVNNCPYNCCSLIHDKVENDEAKTTFWIPYETGGDNRYGDMVIKVRFIKSFDITDDLEMVDTWLVVVNISST